MKKKKQPLTAVYTAAGIRYFKDFKKAITYMQKNARRI